jgi:hypothetical protein
MHVKKKTGLHSNYGAGGFDQASPIVGATLQKLLRFITNLFGLFLHITAQHSIAQHSTAQHRNKLGQMRKIYRQQTITTIIILSTNSLRINIQIKIKNY